MNKPDYHGKYCANGTYDGKYCPYLVGLPPRCTAYQYFGNCLEYEESDCDFRYIRLSACIAEHGLDGSQWSKEPPRDEGHYRVYLDGAKDPTVALVYFLDGEILIDVPGIGGGIGLGRVKLWGPRIEFPDLPEVE